MKTVLNDLFDYPGMKIFQNQNCFKFSLDSILLAEFVDIPLKKVKIIDFCTGNAPIPLIISTKCSHEIVGVEIQKPIFNLAIKNVEINEKIHQIKIIHHDVKKLNEELSSESFDIVTCNPPYFKYEKDSITNMSLEKSIARHEIEIKLDDIIKSAAYLLKTNGALYLVHRCERFNEILEILKKYKLTPKKVQFVYPDYDKNAIIVLIKATKNGKSGLKILKPLMLSNYTSYQNIVGDKL